MHGEPTHFEISTPNAKRAKAFYGPLLGWTFHQMDSGEEGWIETTGIRGGLHENDPDTGIRIYFSVADIDAALETVRELGGESGKPSDEQPGFGRFAACRDNQGVPFGLHQQSSS